MDSFSLIVLLLIIVVGTASLALILYFELRRTQERVDQVGREVETRLSQRVDAIVLQTAERLPNIEQRVETIERQISELPREPDNKEDKDNK